MLLHHPFFSLSASVDHQKVSQCNEEEGDEEEKNASPGPWGQSLHQPESLCWDHTAQTQHEPQSPAY